MDKTLAVDLIIGQLALCDLKYGVGVATRTFQGHTTDNELAYTAGDVIVNLRLDQTGQLTGNVSGTLATGAIPIEHVTLTKAPAHHRTSILKRRRDEPPVIHRGSSSVAVKRLRGMLQSRQVLTDEELSCLTSANTAANKVVCA